MKKAQNTITNLQQSLHEPSKPSTNLHNLLYTKYSTKDYSYSHILSYNLIFNEKCRIVSRFKDFLIYDDSTEFFRRFYLKIESHPRLQRVLTFYESYSKIFPNYMILPESEHLYRNIRKKQKMIDAMNAIKEEEAENRKAIAKEQKKTAIEAYQSNSGTTVFTSKVQKSILKCQPSQMINEQSTINEESVSIAIMMKKIVMTMDHSFDLNDYDGNEGNSNIGKGRNDIRSYGTLHGESKGLKEINSIADILTAMNDEGNCVKTTVGNIKTEDNAANMRRSYHGRGNGKNVYINVQQKKMVMMKQLQQTPKPITKNSGNFFNTERHKNNSNKNFIPLVYGIRTGGKSKEKKVKKYTITSSVNSNGNGNNTNVINNINVPYMKPLTDLNLISSNYQNIIIPQSITNGGNTVININNNFYACTEISLKKSIKDHLQVSSPHMTKQPNHHQRTTSYQPDHYPKQHNDSKIKNTTNTPKSVNKNSRCVKRVITSPLGSFHAQQDIKQKSKLTMTSDGELSKEPTTKSLYRNFIRPNQNYKSIPQKNIVQSPRHYSTKQSLKRMIYSNDTYSSSKFNTNVTSPQRDKEEHSKEKRTTCEIRQRFKKYIDKSHSKCVDQSKDRDKDNRREYSMSMTNRSSRLGFSKSPLKTSVNTLTKRMSGNNTANTSLRKKYNSNSNNNSKKNFSIEENVNKKNWNGLIEGGVKSLTSTNSKLLSPVAHSRYTPVDFNEQPTTVTLIKVNTRAFMERTFSNKMMVSVEENRSSNIKERKGSSGGIYR